MEQDRALAAACVDERIFLASTEQDSESSEAIGWPAAGPGGGGLYSTHAGHSLQTVSRGERQVLSR